MISIEAFKKALGKSAKKMSEADILKLRDLQDRMAEIFFEMWRKQQVKKGE